MTEKEILVSRMVILSGMYDGIVEMLTSSFNGEELLESDNKKIIVRTDFSNQDSELVKKIENIVNNIKSKVDLFSLNLTINDTLDFYLKDFLFEKFVYMLKSDIISNIKKTYLKVHITESDFYFYNKDKSDLFEMIQKNSVTGKNWHIEILINHFINIEKTFKIEIL